MMDVSRLASNCPYCGGKPVVFNTNLFTIECESCCELSVSSETLQGAVNKWDSNVVAVKNMRADNILSGEGDGFDVRY